MGTKVSKMKPALCKGLCDFLIAARILETGQSPPKLHPVNRPMGTPSPDNSFTWSKGGGGWGGELLSLKTIQRCTLVTWSLKNILLKYLEVV